MHTCNRSVQVELAHGSQPVFSPNHSIPCVHPLLSQMHEVRESTIGHDRLAITLWVEYEEDWQKPDREMMPALR